jgi:hypothetical protein
VKSQQPVYLKGKVSSSMYQILVLALNFTVVLFSVCEISNSNSCDSYAGEIVSNHDELMSNFFAQPDALAYGKVHTFLRFFLT